MSEQDRDPVSHLVDRHSGDEPPRDDVIDPDDIDRAAEDAGARHLLSDEER